MLTKNIKCITSQQAEESPTADNGESKSFPCYGLNLSDRWRKVCWTTLHDWRVWVGFVESGKAIGRWIPLTNKQPVWGQEHRCCPLHNQVESGPENERGIEINGGRGEQLCSVKETEVSEEQSPELWREKSSRGSGCLQKPIHSTHALMKG